ncbi:MAG: glutamate--tRNA ligase, partial [Armatimonadota bacterium]
IRVRMAPAPTGRFHIGNARTALYDWLLARHHGGTFILRIEDTDRARSSLDHVAEILEAFRWLGLNYDEGPEVGGDCGPYFQSERLHLYRQAASRLLDEGKAYYCYCTPDELDQRRREIQSKGLAPRYNRQCRGLSPADRERLEAEGRPKAIRFAAPDHGAVAWQDLIRGAIEFQCSELDDFVLTKADGFPTYLLACVVDDAAMAISHVVRGEDLISSTPRQILIYRALDLPAPRFAHLPLILGPDRAKLSKRHGPVAVLDYRDQGFLPDAIVNFIALLGWSPGDDRERLSRDELIQSFSLDGIGKSAAVFDIEKLSWMNGIYLRDLPPDQYLSRARPFLESALGQLPAEFDDQYVARALLLEQERARTLAELPQLTEFFFRQPESYDEKGERKWFGREGAADLLAGVRAALDALPAFDEPAIEAAVRGVADQVGVKPGPVIHTTRLAVTGRTKGPGLFELIAVLGKQRVSTRLAQAEQHIRSLRSRTPQP